MIKDLKFVFIMTFVVALVTGREELLNSKKAYNGRSSIIIQNKRYNNATSSPRKIIQKPRHRKLMMGMGMSMGMGMGGSMAKATAMDGKKDVSNQPSASSMPSVSNMPSSSSVPSSSSLPSSLPSSNPSLGPSSSSVPSSSLLPSTNPSFGPSSSLMPSSSSLPSTNPSPRPSSSLVPSTSFAPSTNPSLGPSSSLVPSSSSLPSLIPSFGPSLSSVPSTSSMPSTSFEPSSCGKIDDSCDDLLDPPCCEDSGCRGGVCEYLECRYLNAGHETAKNHFFSLTNKKNIEQLMKNYPVPVDALGTFHEKSYILTAKECKLLMDCLAAKSVPSGEIQTKAFSMRDRHLSAEELIKIIGENKAQDLLDFLYKTAEEKAPVKRILLRGTNNDGSVGNYIGFHTDYISKHKKLSTLVLALNSEDDIEGGEVIYLNQDGPVQVARTQGTAYAHKHDILHSVAPHRGHHVSLYIQLNHNAAPGDKNLIEGTSLF